MAWSRKWRGDNKVFDSKFEKELYENELRLCEFHPKEKVEYTISHKYSPDFKVKVDDKTYLIEAKGRFVDSTEAAKYVHIAKALEDDTELVFLFYKPETPFPGAKVRKKCRTKRTHSEWAEKQGFRWFTRDNINILFKGGD